MCVSRRRRLAAKADEEDSDGEDTELPLTDAEKTEQQKQLDKHNEQCGKVGRGVWSCVARGRGAHNFASGWENGRRAATRARQG